MKQFSIRLTKKQFKGLDKIMEETGNCRGGIIRMAINEYLQKETNKNFGG